MRRDKWFAAKNASNLEVTHSAAIDVDSPPAGSSVRKAAVKEPDPREPSGPPD
jgi:hypothetical protein